MIMETVINLFLITFLAISLGAVAWGAFAMVKCLKVAGWRKTEGTMDACAIKESKDSEGDPVWSVEVAYSYSVSGKQYNSNRVAYGYRENNCHGEHSALYARLSKGRTVIVRYNPNDPSDATLTYGLHRAPVMLVVGGLIIAFSISACLLVQNDMDDIIWWMFVIALLVFWPLSVAANKGMRDRIEIRE